LFTTSPAINAADWNPGDIAVGVSSGQYFIYDNNGVFKESINDGLGGYTTGCAWNPALDRLYTTNFDNTKVVAYNDAHPHNIAQVIDTNVTSPGGSSESVVFASNGDFFVGHPRGNKLIHHYNSAGTLVNTYDVAVDSIGTDWIDLAVNQTTLFYTSEGRAIQVYDIVGGQQPNFANLPGSGEAFALRLLPPGDGSGGLLVADDSNIKRLDGAGNVIQTYDAPGENSWFALNLDPNGTSFWSADFGTSNFYRFTIDSVDLVNGDIELGPINTGTESTTVFGICLKGEITSGVLFDFGDAPDSYATNRADTGGEGVGPSHVITGGLQIGASIDADVDGQSSVLADGDDLNGTDDEDGVASFDTLFTTTTSYTVLVDVTNNLGAGNDATLIGWIDFDRDGVFQADEASNSMVVGGTEGTTSKPLTWDDIGSSIDINEGNSYVRIRLSTDTLTASSTGGAASDGEVEDYSLMVVELSSGSGTLQFSSANYSVNENGGEATITVTRSGGSQGAISIDYVTSNDTATAGSDYTATSA
jgi:hypothetical protein